MKNTIGMFKLFSDGLRLRILMLLDKQELSVCQIMGITGASQPLVSRNLSLLYRAGFLDERRHGKLRFYSVSEGLSDEKTDVINLLRKLLESDKRFKEDLETLAECEEFQRKAGRCDMKTLTDFMTLQKKRKKGKK
jgi:ArsR family transcriptional regulator